MDTVYEDAEIGVVVPAYNEAEFIGDVIEEMPDYVDTIFVVDDHSTDGTWETVQSYTSITTDHQPSVTAEAGRQQVTTDGSGEIGTEPGSFLREDVVGVRHETNRGRGAAVQTGYRLALMAGHDVVVVMDGDGQMDPAILDKIIEPVVAGKADYAKGNRLESLAHCEKMSEWRLFGNILLTVLTKIASGHWHIRDPQNGYTAISAEALDKLSISDLYNDYGLLNDILVRMDIHEMRVVDVPMNAVYGDETSGIQYRSFVPMLSFLLVRGFLWRLWVKYVTRESV